MSLRMLLLMFILTISCAKKEDDPAPPASTPAASAHYQSCVIASTCVDYGSTTLTSAAVKTICDDANGTAGDATCATSLNGDLSTGICVTTSDGMTIGYRYYLGTSGTAQTSLEQASCTAAGGTFTADPGLVMSETVSAQAIKYCRYIDRSTMKENCIQADINQTSAQTLCESLEGFLDYDCN